MKLSKILASKKSQAAGGAAILVIIIAIVLILYILFLPAEERAELLGEDDGYYRYNGYYYKNGNNHEEEHFSEELLRENVGRLEYSAFDERTYDIPSFRIYSTTEPKSIKTIDSIYVKNSLFETIEKNFSLFLDKELTQNLLLSFNVEEGAGVLIIYLNDHRISEKKHSPGNIDPISLPEDYLREQNTLKFKVSGVGWAFWRTNYYILENIRIIGEVTDITASKAEQSFYVGEIDEDEIEEISLWFYPGCDYEEAGRLKIRLNGYKIFYGVADCGMKNHLTISPDYLYGRDNVLEFTAESGSYLIDNVKIIVELKERIYPIYYFELAPKYFTTEEEPECGKKDGKCPEDCIADRDIDCCFSQSGNNYWCDLPTSNMNDRCVGYVYETQCGRCPSGYEDERGDPPKQCEEECGDDTDDECNCFTSNGKYYDKDCCYEDNEENYWCDEVPITGLRYTCIATVEGDHCRDCPSGYRNEKGRRPDCYYEEPDDEYKLLDAYDVNLSLRFTNEDERKRADVTVNGHTFYIDTYDLIYSRNIDYYVRKNTNSIEIDPRTDLNIAELKVTLEK